MGLWVCGCVGVWVCGWANFIAYVTVCVCGGGVTECDVACPVGTATYGMWRWMNGKTVFNNWWLN